MSDSSNTSTDVAKIAEQLSKVALNEKDNTLDLELNSPADWNQIRAELVRGWNSNKKVPQIKLIESSASDNGSNFQTSLFGTNKNIREAFHEGKSVVDSNKKKLLSFSRKFSGLITSFPLLPIPMAVSKLYCCFDQATEGAKLYTGTTPAMQSSFNLIETWIELVNVCERIMPLGKQKKKDILKEGDTVLEQLVTFTSNTIGRFYTMPYDAEIGEYFMRENYYNTVNLLRVYEFTVLDLLQVPKPLQGKLVTPLPPTAAGLHHWPEGLTREFFTAGLGNVMENCTTAAVLMLDRYYNTPEKAGAIEKILKTDVDPVRLVSGAVTEQFFSFVKYILGQQLFWCGNREHCEKTEKFSAQFARCARCKWVRYCTKDCQTSHWKAKHSAQCMKKPADLEESLKDRRIIIGADEEAE
jgi:hypothetical protein